MTQATAPQRSAAPLIAELEEEARTTRRVLERVPADQLSWRPHPKSTSLGQLALHVATIPSSIAQILAEDTFEAPQFLHAEATSVSELVPALEASVRAAHEFLDGIRATGGGASEAYGVETSLIGWNRCEGGRLCP